MKTLLLTLPLLLVGLLSAQPENLKITIPDGPVPWSSLDIEHPEGQFQFAIVTDRTGGLRPGVFSEAVDKINLLRPPFVMSVGDLITGYTEDTVELVRQWEEFDAMIDRLKMPFFYLPGNHDITNKVMEDLWQERFGPTYYHFVYQDVLFLCLNSEDQVRGAGRGTISDEQYDYIERTLAENTDVKWTLVFLHQPLWDQENPERWPDVEQLLAQREHSVFAGHVHHYQRFQRNNGRYYTLATTGGGSRLRGPRLGEFDHITWVTMTDEGPVMANVALDGIHSDSVTTRADYEFFSGIYQSNPIRFAPVMAKSRSGQRVEFQIHNPADLPVHVAIRPGFSFEYTAELPIDTLTVAPNSVADYSFYLSPRNEDTEDGSLPLAIDLTYDYAGSELRLPLQYRIAPQPQRNLTKTEAPVEIDGQLTEWPELPYEFGMTTDHNVAWGMQQDDEFVYLAARVTDDHVVVREGETAWQQDFVAFVLDAQPMTASIMDQGNGWYSNSIIFLVSPQSGDLAANTFYEERYDFDIPFVCKSTDEGYLLEAAIPLSYVKERQGEEWRQLRVNWVLQDEDPDEEEKPRMTWQPDWRGDDNVIGSGLFFRR